MFSLLSWLSLGGCGLFTLAPLILAIVALIDVVRTGADWYWLPIILFFPVIGPLAYFALVRGPWGGGRFATLSPAAVRRTQATRRLRELSVQLAHWRGPAILVEAGEELLALGKSAEAEQHLREALTAGADPAEVRFPLAQALEVQGRFAEAVPLLQEVCDADPDAKFGQAQLHLARSLDEAGRAEDAETTLRALLERRNFFEAKVRLARLLMRRGENEEAHRLLEEVRSEGRALPSYLRREHRAWLRMAPRLKSGDQQLPKMTPEGAVPQGYRLRLAIGAAALGMLALLALTAMFGLRGCYQFGASRDAVRLYQERLPLIEKLEGLNARYPWPHEESLEQVVLERDELERLLATRAEIADWANATTALSPFDLRNYGSAEWMESQQAYNHQLETLSTLLESHRMGPEAVDQLLSLVDWRYLGQESAMPLGIPPHFRVDWYRSKNAIESQPRFNVSPDPDTARMLERQQQQNRARIEDLERMARSDTAINDETRALFDEHKDELATLSEQSYKALAVILADPSTEPYSLYE